MPTPHPNASIVSSRLTTAFRALRQDGYFARKSWKDCQSCGWAAIPDGQGDRAVFYHRQDAESLQLDGEVFLAWSGSASHIAKRLREAGLTVEHDGSRKDRIRVRC